MATLEVVEGWRGSRRRDEEIVTPPLSENAIHPPGGKRWFEHWYFDARLESGHVVVVMLQARELVRRAPGVEIHVYEPDGTRHQISRKYPAAAVQASSARCDIRVGYNHAWVQDDEPLVHRCVVDEGNLAADLRFESIVPSWQPGLGNTRYGASDFFAWVVGAPRASVSGTIRVGDETLEVRGIGYHDHNWGVGNMPRIVDHWYWGRVYADDITLVYANVFARKRYGFAASTPMMVAHDNRIIVSTGEVEVETGPEIHNEIAGRAYPTWLRLTAPDEVELELDVKQIIHAHDLLDDVPILRSALAKPLAHRLVGHPGYFRFLSDFHLRVHTEDGLVERTGTTLHEMVALG
jgi:hypothetical protein